MTFADAQRAIYIDVECLTCPVTRSRYPQDMTLSAEGSELPLIASAVSNAFPEDVRSFVDSTPWRFAKTYAATWPHEYVVRTDENAPMLLALARHIFEHGTFGRFYSTVQRYHHEGGKVYWSMDSTPETTTLINRCDEAQTYAARLEAGTLPKR